MCSDDVHDAHSAGLAFAKLTGADIDSSGRVELPPEDGTEPDEFEQEFLDRVFLPDTEKTKQHWDTVRDELLDFERIRGGQDISEPCDRANTLDLEGRWIVSLRERYHGRQKATQGELLEFRPTSYRD